MYDFESMDKRLIIYVNNFLVSNSQQTAMDKYLGEITTKQWLTMIMLGSFDEPPTVSMLSALCSTSHQNTKQIVLKLESKGYLKILQDPKDARIKRIAATPKWAELSMKHAGDYMEAVEQIYAGLSDEEIRQYCETQLKIYNNLEELNL